MVPGFSKTSLKGPKSTFCLIFKKKLYDVKKKKSSIRKDEVFRNCSSNIFKMSYNYFK